MFRPNAIICRHSLFVLMFTSLISPLPWFTSFPLRAATSTPRLLTRILGHVHFAHFSFTLVYFFTPQGRHIHTQALDSSPWSCSLRSFLLYLGLLLSPSGPPHPHPGSWLESLVMFTSLISPLPWFTSFPLRAATSTPRLLTRILGHVHFAHFSFTLVYFFTPQGRHIHTQALDSSPWSCSLRSFLLYLGLLLYPSGPTHPHPGSWLESLVHDSDGHKESDKLGSVCHPAVYWKNISPGGYTKRCKHQGKYIFKRRYSSYRNI